MREQSMGRRASSLFPKYFEVASTSHQRSVGYIRIGCSILIFLSGLVLAKICCPRLNTDVDIGMAVAILCVFTSVSLYLLVFALRYDLGKVIVIEGDTLSVDGRSWKRNELMGLVCDERSASRQRISHAVEKRRYKVCDADGRTVCRLRDNYENYTCLYHWIMQGKRDSDYREVRI